MRVFNTYFKVLKKNLGAAITYTIIFLAIAVMMASNSTNTTDFTDTKLDVAVIDNDNTTFSKNLTSYIGKKNNLVQIKNNKDTILDSIYYETVSYVLIIKKGAQDKISASNADGIFENYKMPNSYDGEFFENTLNQYCNTVSAYMAGGSDISDAMTKAQSAINQKVSVKMQKTDTSGSADYPKNFASYFNFLPYIFISIYVMSICPVMAIFANKDLRDRTDVSGMSPAKQTAQLFLASSLFSFGVWLLFMVAALVLGHGLFNTRVILAIVNSFVFAVVAAAIAFLVASFSPKRNIVSMIANVVGLGMSFMCGVFVPQEYLGSGVLSAARCLPAYWYVKANNLLCGRAGEVYSVSKYWTYIGIELAFAAVLFIAIIIVRSMPSRKVRAKS